MNISNYYWYFSGVLQLDFVTMLYLMLMNKKKQWQELVAMVTEN